MRRKRWQTQELVKLLTDARWKATVGEAGGGVDTESVVLTAVGGEPDTSLTVAGFTYSGDDLDNKSDADIDAIEVTDGEDADGGLNTGCLKTCLMYGEVVSRLRKAGWVVVASMDNYF